MLHHRLNTAKASAPAPGEVFQHLPPCGSSGLPHGAAPLAPWAVPSRAGPAERPRRVSRAASGLGAAAGGAEQRLGAAAGGVHVGKRETPAVINARDRSGYIGN